VSDKYANDSYGLIKIPVDGGFKDLQALKGKMEIGETLRDTLPLQTTAVILSEDRVTKHLEMMGFII